MSLKGRMAYGNGVAGEEHVEERQKSGRADDTTGSRPDFIGHDDA